MTYRVTMTATAVKERKRLDATGRKRIDATLRSLLENPRPHGAKKLSGSQHDWGFVWAITAFCMQLMIRDNW